MIAKIIAPLYDVFAGGKSSGHLYYLRSERDAQTGGNSKNNMPGGSWRIVSLDALLPDTVLHFIGDLSRKDLNQWWNIWNDPPPPHL